MEIRFKLLEWLLWQLVIENGKKEAVFDGMALWLWLSMSCLIVCSFNLYSLYVIGSGKTRHVSRRAIFAEITKK